MYVVIRLIAGGILTVMSAVLWIAAAVYVSQETSELTNDLRERASPIVLFGSISYLALGLENVISLQKHVILFGKLPGMA